MEVILSLLIKGVLEAVSVINSAGGNVDPVKLLQEAQKRKADRTSDISDAEKAILDALDNTP